MARAITIRNRRDGTTVTAKLGPGTPAPGPYGGWEEQTRPRRRGFPVWNGQPLIGQTVSAMFDGYSGDTSVEFFVRLLENMASADGVERPPTIKISGPIRHTEKIWVIDDIEWTEGRRNPQEVLTYQAFDLHLIEWDDGEVVRLRTAKSHREPNPVTVYATVKKRGERGETLLEVLGRVLGTSAAWQTVAKLNKIADPRKPLKPGRHIRTA